ncbi:hypothetical protein RSOLAG1IB_06775 [Rhizoctonia solani AG-1 IB]|uniref:Protein kinase domain-containing protein n=1 Tax=Thanatephorus cucumeris (strain AG1-IB / isolate 7/3/14) TaxID=1108050 RepID=A0A0B7F7Q3_THACB|nr:hypothetical protein RSOLAG1IB_06775 [Rhizoctonia solani AG-1 IB]
MALYEATYVPKWYTKASRVIVKTAYGFESSPLARASHHSIVPNEVAILAQIEHPCIHKLLGIDSSAEHQQVPYMIFEPLSQLTLDLFLIQPRTSFLDRVRVLQDIASALTYLHEHKNGSIAHGNICPPSIYILPDGRAKLTHFTCAFQYISGNPSSSAQRPEAASSTATAAHPSFYRSPESRTTPDSESGLVFPTLAGDVWGFGAVMLRSFSALFGEMDSQDDVLRLGADNSPLDLPGVTANCDPRTLAMLQSTLTLDPFNRPSISTVLSDLSTLG